MSKASPGKESGKKARDPLTKRFTNGHKCFTAMQSQFMVEIMGKDESKRLHFEDNKYLLKAPRDPVNGEVTARDDAKYLVAYDGSVEEGGKTSTNPASTIDSVVSESKLKGTKQMLRVVEEMARCESLRHRKGLLMKELDMVNEVLQHKSICAQGGFTGKGKTLERGTIMKGRTKPF